MSVRRTAGLSGCAPCRLRCHGHPASIPHAFAPGGAARFACLQGIGVRPIPAARGLAPLEYRRTGFRRIGQASVPPAKGRAGRGWTRRGLLRQVARMRAFLNAAGSHPSRHEGQFTDTLLSLAMEIPHHASRLAPQSAAGMLSLVVGVFDLACVGKHAAAAFVRGCRVGQSPFGVVRPKASLSRCESWRWRGCASGFMAATVRRKQFPPALSLRSAHSSRGKFFAPPGSPLRCDRMRCSQPVPRRPDHNKDAMGADLVPP